MGSVMRGTTPVIKYRFNVVDVSNIAVAYMTIKCRFATIERTLADAVIDTENNVLTWKLTQAETLSLRANDMADIQLRYKLSDGTAGGSQVYHVPVERILKEGVI